MLISCSLTSAHHKVICRKSCGWARKEWCGNGELKYACPFSHLGKRQEKFANICALKLCQWLLSRSAGVEKNKPLFECFYFVILQLGCVRHLVVLMDSFFQSCLQRSNLLLFVLEGARQLIGLRCNFLQSSEGKKKSSISKYLAETNCSEETTKIDWIRSNFILDVDPPFSNSFTRNWFDDKKKQTTTLLHWVAGEVWWRLSPGMAAVLSTENGWETVQIIWGTTAST